MDTISDTRSTQRRSKRTDRRQHDRSIDPGRESPSASRHSASRSVGAARDKKGGDMGVRDNGWGDFREGHLSLRVSVFEGVTEGRGGSGPGSHEWTSRAPPGDRSDGARRHHILHCTYMHMLKIPDIFRTRQRHFFVMVSAYLLPVYRLQLNFVDSQHYSGSGSA